MLSDGTLRRLINSDPPLMEVPMDRFVTWGDIRDSQIQPASVDVRLGEQLLRHPSGETVFLGADFSYLLKPGECVLGALIERVNVPPNMVGRVEGKSSIARRFLTVHSAGFIDPGFSGDITLELKNDGEILFELRPGMMIAQISFELLDATAVRSYGHWELKSHYQYQQGPTQSRG